MAVQTETPISPVSESRLDAVAAVVIIATFAVLVASVVAVGWMLVSSPMTILFGVMLVAGATVGHELTRRDSRHVIIDLTD